MRGAFLSMDNTDGWSIDADLAIPPLQELGWHIDTVAWRSPDVDWGAYDAVYIGTPWDYPDDVAHFIRVLEKIDLSGAVLVNDFELVRWGIPKTYLRDLEARGADIVPSLWFDCLSPGQLSPFFEALCSDRLVIKPVVSTNARDTFLLDRDHAADKAGLLLESFRDRAFVVQPFIENIRTEGEYSLFYFAGACSHAVQKVPKAGDFRVQEEHGAGIRAVIPDASLVACADRILGLVKPQPVYARCDLVRGPDGRFLLMELELIEPSMYLRMHPDAPQRFAVAFDRYVASEAPGSQIQTQPKRPAFAEREDL
jgi:glutathione synthase/RimK-type ligase-like ATP-grasp enzyme